jgi:acetyl-CoA acetyltransferase
VIGPSGFITAGNASQLSDGASASVLMEASVAEKKGLTPLGRYVGMAVAGTKPDEMGIGPVFAIPKLLEKNGLSIGDIGLWELNEAFAVQVLYCRDKLGIPDELLNVNGGAIIWHVRGTNDRSRADRGQAARREVRRRHHVHRRRPGRSGAVRGSLNPPLKRHFG